MPNSKVHMVIGAVTGMAVNVMLQTGRIALSPSTKFDWGEILVCTAAASAAALLPDVLEPADSPNHRAIFHSVAIGILVAYVMTGKHTRSWPPITTLLASAAGIGYLSHLAADAFTPKSITII
jgi:membrane-bound metal-dependent hydrolase YbcI (DUF457 family)